MSHKAAKRHRSDSKKVRATPTGALLSRRGLLWAMVTAIGAAVVVPFVSHLSERAADDSYDWIKQKLRELEKKNGAFLKAEYSAEFQLFAIVNEKIIINPASEEATIAIDWSTSKVLEITPTSIRIQIPDAVIGSGTKLSGNTQIGPNKVGRWATMLSVQGWSSHIEILETTPQYVIAAIGYSKSKP